MSKGGSELGLLQSHKDWFMSEIQKVDFLQFKEELCQGGIITEEDREVFSNIDLRVGLKLRVKYLLQLIRDQVCEDKALFYVLLNIMIDFNIEVNYLFESWELDSDKKKDQVTDRLLTMNDIPALIESLAKVAHKWKGIGIAVHVPDTIIYDIENDRDNSFGRLNKILSAWIIGRYKQPVTLNTLKNVLRSPIVAVPIVADNLSLGNSIPAPKKPTINMSPRIFRQSRKTVVSYGMSTLLEVQVNSDKPVSYQWMKDGQPLSDGTSYHGTSSNILLVNHRNMASKHIEGKYVCAVESIGRSKEISVTIEYPESIKCLLKRYSLIKEVPKDSWPPVIMKSYVELALIKRESDNLYEHDYSVRGDIDDIMCSKENISYEKCFGKYKSRTLLVVEGRPGVGKTTLAHKVTRDWSTGNNVLIGADLVFLVSLRNKINSIFKSFRFNSDKIDEDLIEDFESHKGLKCCFLLDGLDEYHQYDKNEENIVYNLIKKESSEAMVIVFSRPVGNKKLVESEAKVDTQIEILGFKGDQISHYINTYFQQDSQKAEQLKKYLDEHINVLHMCYLPVHVAMICHIHSLCKDSNVLNTESQIYECFAMLTILRKLQRECKKKVPHQFTCFQSLNDKDKKSLMKICKLAFDMCVDQRQVFESGEIILSDESDSDESLLGLVTVDSTANLYHLNYVYTFLHLTFQEYLAAYHIFSQTSDQQLSIIDQHKDNDAMLVVFKFYCGMMGLQKDKTFNRQFQAIFSSKHADTLYRVHCAFESQQPAVCDAAIDHDEVQSSLSFKKKLFTSGDYNAISYVISEASGPISKLAFYSCRFKEDGVRHLIETITNNRLQQVNTFVFHSSDPSLNQIYCVNCLLSRMESLEVLDLHKTTLSPNAIIKIADNVLLPHLRCFKIKLQVPDEFVIDYFQVLSTLNFISKLETVHYHMNRADMDVTEAVRNCNALKCLFSSSIIVKYEESLGQYAANFSNLVLERNLNFNVFTHCSVFYFVNCSINDRKIVTFSESLSNCNSVKDLVLDFNQICQGAKALVSKCTKLKHLSIRCNLIDDEGAKSLAGVVCECTDLVHLDLEYNRFGDEGAIAIASAVSHLKIKLYLWNADITKKGVDLVLSYISSANIHYPQICDFSEVSTHNPDYFHRAIKCCTSISSIKINPFYLSQESARHLRHLIYLEKLHVVCDSVTIQGAKFSVVIFDCLHFFSNLLKLVIDNNDIDPDGAAALADGLKYCINLQTLDMCGNNIGSKGAKALAAGLKSCTNLKTLDIKGNDIGSEGAKALPNGLMSCTKLQALDISWNYILPDGAKALAGCLKFCINLQTMNISDNNIGSEGAAALADGLKFCTNLQALYASRNSFFSKGAEALAGSLESCTNLQILDVCWNNIGPKGAIALGDGLKFCNNLQMLNVSNNCIDSEGAAALANGLKFSTTLQTLDICKNNIDSRGAAALADGLKSWKNLQTLNVSDNSTGLEGASALANGLVSCTNLLKFDISWNNLFSEGAAELAVGLQSCSNLQMLDICGNSIGSEGAAVLADGLMSCTNLQWLDISNNNIDPKVAIALFDGMRAYTNSQIFM